MALTEQRAEVVWEGDLARGKGVFTVGTGAIPEQEVSWASRAERRQGKTSPEELIAAAHASCFSMAFSAGLGQAGTPPERLTVAAVVAFDPQGPTVVSSALTVRGKVPNMDQAAFRAAAEVAKANCPVSKALRGNVEITLDAQLES